MTVLDEEARAAAYRAQEATRYRNELHNQRVTLAGSRTAFRALVTRWDPIRQWLLERQITEPDVPPFITEAEDPIAPIPHRYPPLP